MNARNLVNVLFERSNLTQSEYAKMLCITRNALWDRLNTKKTTDMTVSVMANMLSALGYKVIVVKKEMGMLDGSYDVE